MTKKDIGALAMGVLLSFVIAFVGPGLLWLLVIGRTRTSSNKDALVNLMIVQALVVNPLMAGLVGVFVAWFAQKAFVVAGGTQSATHSDLRCSQGGISTRRNTTFDRLLIAWSRLCIRRLSIEE